MLIWSSCKDYVCYSSYKTFDIDGNTPKELIDKLQDLANSYPSEENLFCTLDHRQAEYDDYYSIYIDEWRKPTLAEKKEREAEEAKKDENQRKIKQQAYERLKKELGYD